MTRASTPTLVSLDRWAKYMGMNPVHFAGARAGGFFSSRAACDDIWVQHQWQSDDEMVSREELAYAIATAEQDIANVLGYYPAPVWIEQESHLWTSGNRQMQMQTGWGKVIAGGKRKVVTIDADAAVVYSDPDNDGWNELATITVTLADDYGVNEIKVGFVGENGDPAFEIRPLRNVFVAGNTATILIDAWQLIDPDLWESIPTTGVYTPIDVTTTANYVTQVNVYAEYNDTTAPHCVFYLPAAGGNCYVCGGNGCQTCATETQNGCIAVLDARFGKVLPYPADYTTNAWQGTVFSSCGTPQKVHLNYYAGDVSQAYLRGFAPTPMPFFLEEAVIWLATARLPKGVCGCANVKNRVADLQKDMAVLRDNNTVYARFDTMSMFKNPFGVRNGEIKAWERVARLVPDAVWSAAVV